VHVTQYLGAFVLNLVVFAVFGKRLKSGGIAWIWENSPLVATLVVRENISLTINIVLSETLTEFRAVVRTQ
jgi:hypothetical protein